MYNKRALNVDLGKFTKPDPYKDDILYTEQGQWQFPGQPTRIPSNDITMEGVPYPVYGIDNTGYEQMMYPGEDYTFPGDYVDEYPMAKRGGYMQSLPKKKSSKRYSRSLTATNKLFTKNPFFKNTRSKKNRVFDPNAKYYQDGGALPEDYSQFINFAQTLPSNLQDPEYQYGNPDQYNLYGMWETVGKPQSFKDVQDSDYFPLQDDGEYHGFTVGSDGEFLKPMSHSTTWKEVMNSELNTNPYFKENRLIKNEQGRLQYVPNKQKGGFHDDINKRRQVLRDWTYGKSIGMLQEPDGGYIELDLSEEEMDQYRKGGYIVEDISIPTLTKAEYGMPMGTGISQNYMGNTRTFYQTGGKTVPKFQSGSEKDKKKLITYKTDAKLIDGTAAFDLISKVPISADYNQQIKDRLYSGKWGFDPNTGALVKLNKSQQATIPTDIKNIRQEEKEDQEYRQAIARGEIKPRIDTPIQQPANQQMTKQEVEDFVRQGYDAAILNPAFQTAAYFTPPGMAIGAIQGAANLIPDLYAGDYEYAAIDAASILPFAKPIANTVKSAVKNTYKINPWAFKANPEAYYRGIGEAGMNDALNTGVLRPNRTGKGLTNNTTYDAVFFDKGSTRLAGALGKGNIAEVKNIPMKEFSPNHMGVAAFDENTGKFLSEVPLGDDTKILKKHWLKGYKEVPKPQSAANTPVRSGFDGNLITRPFTPFSNNELTPGTQWYRKIGNEAGLQDLINKQGAKAPAPMKMKSGIMLDAPFFGRGVSPTESYKGLYAAEVKPEAASKYNWRSRVAGVDNYGSVPFENDRLVSNFPLEDLNVYRKKWFSNNYKQLDPTNLEEGLKNAALQRNLENVYKWGVREYLGKSGYDYVNTPDQEKKYEDEQYALGGAASPKDLNPATMQKYKQDLRLQENSIKAGYNKAQDKWYPHASVEGGNKTIGYGHKLTNAEVDKFNRGITSGQVEELLTSDILKHQAIAENMIDKKYGKGAFDKLPQSAQMIFVDYAYNGVLGQFPTFTDALVKRNKNLMLKEYERSSSGGKLTERNNWTRGIIEKNFQDGGPIELELTPEEIDWYISQGYEVEDLN